MAERPMTLHFVLFWLILLIGLGACSAPACPAGMEPGETGRVVRVMDGDAMALHTGQIVRLVGIEAPALERQQRAGEPYAEESRRLLEDHALGRQFQLCYPGLTRDRYDRALAHAVSVDGRGTPVWLNRAQVETGAARVRLYPDTQGTVGQAFLNAERVARQKGLGLWRKQGAQPLEAADLTLEVRGFQLINARLGAIRAQTDSDPDVVCVREIQNSALQLRVRLAAARVCTWPSGESLRVRGWVSEGVLDLAVTEHAETRESPD